MKRILLLIFLVLLLCLVAVYAFIPANIKMSNEARTPTIPKNIAQCLQDAGAWRKWWPGPQTTSSGSSEFMFGSYNYKLVEPFTDGAEIVLNKAGTSFSSRIFIIPSGKDSSLVEWQTLLTAGYNPIQRVVHWFEGKDIRNTIQPVLNSLVNFAANTKNIYGFPIVRTTFTDTILAATKFSSGGYPTTEVIYNGIDRLKKKITDDGANEKDFPMLNVQQTDSNRFETTIAICVNKEIKNEGKIFVSRMVPMKDRFLRTEVTGGPASIKNAHEAVKNYMEDRFLSAPAIPFEILVTDRRNETDTSKWKTVIFHPSM
jgi:hypothetical protein